MKTLSFDSKRCEPIRQYIDSYLSNELLVETVSELVRHLESCEACSRELESRTRVRDALQRAVANRPVPDSARADVLRSLRKSQPRSFLHLSARTWAVGGLARIALALFILFGLLWLGLHRGTGLVASILKIGVSDHVLCTIKGHNYPEVANPPDEIRKKLGARYAPLVQVVQERLPGFEVLEGHICSPQNNREYIHLITRGQGTIVSVILTKRNGASLPTIKSLLSDESAGLSIYQDHIGGMEIAGFESAQYFVFIVSDLSHNEMRQLARGLAPVLNETLRSTALTRLSPLSVSLAIPSNRQWGASRQAPLSTAFIGLAAGAD
jgi:Putative zinc-finger